VFPIFSNYGKANVIKDLSGYTFCVLTQQYTSDELAKNLLTEMRETYLKNTSQDHGFLIDLCKKYNEYKGTKESITSFPPSSEQMEKLGSKKSRLAPILYWILGLIGLGALISLIVFGILAFTAKKAAEKISLEDYQKILKGVFEGSGIVQSGEEIIKCVKKVPNEYNIIINTAKKVMADDVKLQEKLTDILNNAKKLAFDLSPCLQNVKKISEMNVGSVVTKLLIDPQRAYKEITTGIDDLKNKDYEAFGIRVGHLIAGD